MRIRLLISVAASTWSAVPGDIVDWADDAARAYVDAGYAEIAGPAPAETPALSRAKGR